MNVQLVFRISPMLFTTSENTSRLLFLYSEARPLGVVILVTADGLEPSLTLLREVRSDPYAPEQQS